MANEIPSNPGSPLTSLAGGPPLERQRDEKRKRLVELEYGLRAIALHVAAVQAELKDLEGFSITGLISGIKGDRTARAQVARQQIAELEAKLEAGAADIESLRHEVEKLDQRIAAQPMVAAKPTTPSAGTPLPTTGQTLAASAAAQPNPEAQAKLIERAAEALQAARKGLLADLETVSAFGRVNLGSLIGGAKGVRAATQARARSEASERLRSDILRFLRRFDEAVAPLATIEETEVRTKLEQAAESLTSKRFGLNQLTQTMADDVLQTFALADMLLEKRLNDLKSPVGDKRV
jgi:hypothetical protein